jgi:hypothetical protein
VGCVKHICIYLATDTGPDIYESASFSDHTFRHREPQHTLIESLMIRVSGFGTGLSVDTRVVLVPVEYGLIRML